MNAYKVCDDLGTAFEKGEKVLKHPLNVSLTELHCALFVLQRHHRWNAAYSDDDDERVVQLI